jgi:hypothetical protein
VYLFLQLPTFKNNKNNLYQYIPSNSIILIKGNSPQKLRKNLEKANMVWNKLQGVDIFNLISQLLSEEADLVDKEEMLRNVLDEKPITITINKVNDKFEPLVFLDIEDDKYLNLIEKIYENEKRIVDHFQIESEQGFTVEDRAKRKWYVIKLDNVLIIAFDKTALKNCVLDIKLKKTLHYDKGFEKAKNMSVSTDLVCLINNKEIYHINNYLFKPAYFNRNIWSVKQQDWTNIDFTFAPNEIKFSSIWQDSDSNSIWNFLKANAGSEYDYLKSIPNNTFGFSTIALENYELFYDKNIERFDDEKSQIHNRYFNTLAKENKEQVIEKFKALIKGRFINIKTKVDTIGFSELSLIEINDTNNLHAFLSDISDTVFAEQKKIYKLRKNDLFSKLCFQYLQSKKADYLLVQFPYLVLSSNKSALKNYSSLILENKNTFNDKEMNKYFLSKFNNKSMFFAFERWHNLEFSKMDWLNEKNFDRAREYMKFLKLMDYSGIQIAFKNNQVIMQGNIQTYNAIEEAEKGLLWQKNLDGQISKLKIIYNHKTQSQDLFVEDKAHQVYLFNSSGLLLWKQQINDSIVGEISSIDWFKNKKTQILFNTKNEIYCIDINGAYLEKFPIKLKDIAVSGISLFDYDNDGNYRMLYLNDQRLIKNVTTTGDALGFKPYQLDNIGQFKVSFLRADNKDHLIIIDTAGQVYLLDRKGKIIDKLVNRIKYNDKIQLEFSNKLNKSKIYYLRDSRFCSLSLSDETEEQDLGADFIDLNVQKKQVFARYIRNKQFGVVDSKINPVFSFTGEKDIYSGVLSFAVNDTLCHIIQYLEDNEAIILSAKRTFTILNFPKLEGMYFYQPTEELKYFIKTEGNQLKCYYFQELN